MFEIARFYQFIPLTDTAGVRQVLLTLGKQANIGGSILLAEEGLNGTLAGESTALRQFLHQLCATTGLQQQRIRYNSVKTIPFFRFKILLKKEIISMGLPGICNQPVAEHLTPAQWNELITDPDTLVLDTRNDYEVRIGHFKNAVDPEIKHFRHFAKAAEPIIKKENKKNVAIYCTGGIRCEKASAWLIQQGYNNVYQLNGGILSYFEQVPAEHNLWQGECFVFDQRIAVTRTLETGSHTMCYGCRGPLSAEDKLSPMFVEGISCPHCYHQLNEDQKQRFAERMYQIKLAKQRQQRHVGPR